ncbi:MAG: hypothetical protein Q9208_005023 [Pyrenodesmia sp. 3 TL-2023]
MRSFSALAIPLALIYFATTTLAMVYNDCKGSSLFPARKDCIAGLRTINATATYNNLDEFSVRTCMIQYRTDDEYSPDVFGRVILDVAKRIMKGCLSGHGSLGTGNCEKCHVTMNYRAGHGGKGTFRAPEHHPGDISSLDAEIGKPAEE